MFKYIKVREYAAHGGPAEKGTGSDGFPTGPTKEGRYVIQVIAPYSSNRYRDMSAIRWGTQMRVMDGVVQVQLSGKWTNLSKVDPKTVWYYPGDAINKPFEAGIKAFIEKQYKEWYGISKVPDKWVFNDFGHITIEYYVDTNNNYQMDKGEFLVGDKIHTTPQSEARRALHQSHTLTQSHGCVHMRPADIDDMIQSGFVKKGQVVEVHPYTDITYPQTFERETMGRPPYELHFFPGCPVRDEESTSKLNKGLIVIYSVNTL